MELHMKKFETPVLEGSDAALPSVTGRVIDRVRLGYFSDRARKMTAVVAISTGALVFLPFVVDAYESVEVNGDHYICENSCDVNFKNDGSYTVSDRFGGWAAKVVTNGGELKTEAPKTP